MPEIPVGRVVSGAGDVGAAVRAPSANASARKLVLVATALLLFVNVYRADRQPGSLYRRLWGTGVVGVMLAVVADFAPEIAGPFALLVALGSFTNGGDQAIQAVLGRASSAAPLSPSQARTAAPAARAGAAAAGAAAHDALKGGF